ncbi:hypothetical protein AWV79_02340 [Cupriavidus sp. UYMMa02A]|nr:hypothetical protein AWV79_02340 [Cupriavidus sp. UYMMa02A]
MRNCVVRLFFPNGKAPLVQSPVRTMPCPSGRRVFGRLVGWRKRAIEEPRNADHVPSMQALCENKPVRSLAR